MTKKKLHSYLTRLSVVLLEFIKHLDQGFLKAFTKNALLMN